MSTSTDTSRTEQVAAIRATFRWDGSPKYNPAPYRAAEGWLRAARETESRRWPEDTDVRGEAEIDGPRPLVRDLVSRQWYEIDYGNGSAWALPCAAGRFRTAAGRPYARSVQFFGSAGDALAHFELIRAVLGHEAVMASGDLRRLRNVPQWDDAIRAYDGLAALAKSEAYARDDDDSFGPVLPLITPNGVMHETCTGHTVVSVHPATGGDSSSPWWPGGWNQGEAVLVFDRYAPLDWNSDRDQVLAVLSGYGAAAEPEGRTLGLAARRLLSRLCDRDEYRAAYLRRGEQHEIADGYGQDPEWWTGEAAWLERRNRINADWDTGRREGHACTCGHGQRRHSRFETEAEASPCADCDCRLYVPDPGAPAVAPKATAAQEPEGPLEPWEKDLLSIPEGEDGCLLKFRAQSEDAAKEFVAKQAGDGHRMLVSVSGGWCEVTGPDAAVRALWAVVKEAWPEDERSFTEYPPAK